MPSYLTTFRTLVLANFYLFSAIPACGIINGIEVDLKSDALAKHTVALQMEEVQPDGTTYYYKASAVVIADEILLTAGHNVAYIPDVKNVTAIFSETPCWGENTCGEKRIAAIDKKVHPKFRQISGGTEYDLALVKLSERLPKDFLNADLAEGKAIGRKSLRVIGYGTNSEKEGAALNTFRERGINLLALDPRYILGTTQKFWLDQKRGGFCSGDSGGPVFVRQNKKRVLAGIAIHVTYPEGKQKCLTKGAFTDLAYFGSWLDEALEELK